ncbi:MAG: hypothetical protein ABIN89_17615 [Chitinophagaceae bacterium]
MSKKVKVGFATKLLSNHYYLNEVQVEGKATNKFNFKIGLNDQYAAQIIRTGNCITLLSNPITLTDDSFWNTNYFEDLTHYVFWTFNKSFLLKLMENIETLKLPVLKRCAELLLENFIPYAEPLDDHPDEELKWCHVKNENLKRDPKFSQMYLLDEQNRTAILHAVEKRITEFPMPLLKPLPVSEPAIPEDETQPGTKIKLFLEVLKPINGSTEETLQFIQQKIEEAGFEFNLFSPVPRLENGKNPYGLNGCMGAMIDHFYQVNYFKKEYTLEQIFKAYLQYSGNSIGKLKAFLSEFRQDKSYLKHFEKLKALKLKKQS